MSRGGQVTNLPNKKDSVPMDNNGNGNTILEVKELRQWFFTILVQCEQS